MVQAGNVFPVPLAIYSVKINTSTNLTLIVFEARTVSGGPPAPNQQVTCDDVVIGK